MQAQYDEIDLAATKSREKRLIEEVALLKDIVRVMEVKHADSKADYEKKIKKLTQLHETGKHENLSIRK